MQEKELFTPFAEDIMALRKAEQQFSDEIDRIYNNRHYSISKKEAEEAKARLKTATRIITKEHDYSRKLNDQDRQRIWALIDNLITKENVTILLRKIEGEIGIEEVISGKKFLFK
jgi:hypothetical protein